MTAASPAFRYALTAIFAVAGSHCLIRCLLPRGDRRVTGTDRLAGVAHALMSAGMIVMIWDGLSDVRALSVGVFGVAAGWFGVHAAVARCGRSEQAQHALAMLGMLWMLLVPPSGMAPAPAAHPMSAVDMSGAAMSAPGLPGRFAGTGGVVLGSYFLLATLWWMGRSLRHNWTAPQRLPGGLLAHGPTLAVHAVMSAAMGMMLLAM